MGISLLTSYVMSVWEKGNDVYPRNMLRCVAVVCVQYHNADSKCFLGKTLVLDRTIPYLSAIRSQSERRWEDVGQLRTVPFFPHLSLPVQGELESAAAAPFWMW